MSTEAMSQGALYWLADCTGIALRATKARVTGTGKLKIPLVNKQRLVCNLAVVASMWKPKLRFAALCVHVRWDLYLVIGLDHTSSNPTVHMYAVDATKIKCKMTDVFKGARTKEQAYANVKSGVVKGWKWNNKANPSAWYPVDVDSVG